MPPCTDGHDWRPTGREGVHVEFPTKTNGWRRLYAGYVRCAKCRQDGFRKRSSAVVYTWRREDVT